MQKRNGNLSPAKEITYVAVCCALLIGAQFAFAQIPGIEIVTVLLLCFSYVFGARFGWLLGVSFSLLRCFLFGAVVNVIILYLIYFPAFGALFGAIGYTERKRGIKFPVWLVVAVNVILLALACACTLCAVYDLIRITRLWKQTLTVLLWVITGLCCALCLAFDLLFILAKLNLCTTERWLQLILITTVAALCTVCFTMIDNVLTPFFYGYTLEAGLIYFYGSFLAVLPQVVCTIATVSTLFYPLTHLLKKIL